MSRARLICSEIVSRMSAMNQFDEKSNCVSVVSVLSQDNTKDKGFNLCSADGTDSAIGMFTESTEISPLLVTPEMSVDDWLKQKTIDSIDVGYLNDVNFLLTKDPDMSDMELADKTAEKDCCSDPLLNFIPINEELLRKPKCDRLLGGKDLDSSDTELNLNKTRCTWDTMSIASRKSDCDLENNSDFSDLNLLPFSFDTSDHMSALETVDLKSIDSTQKNDFCQESNQISIVKKKEDKNPRRPNILRPKIKEDSYPVLNVPLTADRNINVDMYITTDGELSQSTDSIFDFQNPNIKPSSSEFLQVTEIEEAIAPSFPKQILCDKAASESSSSSKEDIQVIKQNRISEINNMTGSIAFVSNSTVNSKHKTKIIIKTDKGDEKYEGNTADLMETTGNSRKDRNPLPPVEGKHIVTSVKTAATILEEKKLKGARCKQEPEEALVKEMLSVLGITDDMLYTMLTDLGLRMWVCPEHECRRIFNRLNTLISHILSHYGLKPFKCDFPNCPWSFYTSFKLKRHRETHLKRKDFICTVPDCNRSFTTIYNLNTHLKLHERPARLKCLVRSCNCRFQTRRAMEMHLKTHETSLAPYKCTFPGCNRSCYLFSALTAHLRSHQHKEEELRCDWENCGRLFDKPCRLKAHMRQHTGDKPYVCKFKDCKWAFSSSSKLKRHQHKHNNERKFRCTIGNCTKAFLRSEHLKEHTFTHIAQKTFQCSICGEKCSAKATLYVHKKKFHPNENTKIKKTVTSGTPSAKVTQFSSEIDANQIIADANNSSSIELQQPSHLVITLLPAGEGQSNEQETSFETEKEMTSYDLDLDSVTPVNTFLQNNLEEKVVSEKKSAKKTKPKKKIVTKGCARTYLPYNPITKKLEEVNETTLESVVIETVMTSNDATSNITLSSDIMLGTDILQNSSDTICLSNLMLQDDVRTELYNADDGNEYILLLDSEANSSFPESTINLRDLD